MHVKVGRYIMLQIDGMTSLVGDDMLAVPRFPKRQGTSPSENVILPILV